MPEKYRHGYVNFDVWRYGTRFQRQIYSRQLEIGIEPRFRIKVKKREEAEARE